MPHRAHDNASSAGTGLTVGAVAARVGVTVRALHHWDSIGLVRPSGRTHAGYRLYTAQDLSRVHRVLVYRELGVPLDDILALLEAPGADADASLRKQRDRLRERMARLRGMAEALDRVIEARESGILLSADQQVEIFGENWDPSWAGEAYKRWGDTRQWAQYAERSAERTAEEWRRIADGVEALTADLAAAFRKGTEAGSEEANALADRHRASIDSYFDCTISMQVCIGRGFVTDPEVATFYDDVEPGLANWLREIIEANARANGVDPETATWN
ncbi:MerR family transcriptional regulator [Prauserella marina]|nr:MerR family transcriptional regulator [Prauserella marina]ASR38848.1 MerR family transcriptional regulator [Prauserella marina]